MSTHYTPPDSGNSASNNGSSFVSRREARASNTTGALPIVGSSAAAERGYSSSYEFEYLIQSLHDLFEHDRQVASQSDTTRCGICYLYFPLSELVYREEGHYVCQGCEHTLGKHRLPMVRKQQRL